MAANHQGIRLSRGANRTLQPARHTTGSRRKHTLERRLSLLRHLRQGGAARHQECSSSQRKRQTDTSIKRTAQQMTQDMKREGDKKLQIITTL